MQVSGRSLARWPGTGIGPGCQPHGSTNPEPTQCKRRQACLSPRPMLEVALHNSVRRWALRAGSLGYMLDANP